MVTVTIYESQVECLPDNRSGQSKKKHKDSASIGKLSRKISQVFEIPVESVSHSPMFIIKGRNEIEVTGCMGILEYSDGKIVLSLKNDTFTVCGSELILSNFTRGSLFIRGRIASASFGGNNA